MSATIEVATWADLRALPAAMDELADQLDAVVGHARAWVCSPAGFEPSPVCVLRPLAEVMGVLDEAFARAGRIFAEQWERVRDGVVVATDDLGSTDDAVARAFPVLPAGGVR